MAPDVPARHRAILAVGNPWYPSHGRDTEVALAFASGAFVLAMPLSVASYCLAYRLAGVRWWEMLLLPHVAYAVGALLAGAGAAVLLKWVVLNGPPLVGQTLSRRAYRRLAVRYTGRFITVGDLDAHCRPLARRAQRAVQIVLSDATRRRGDAVAEVKTRLRGTLWKVARDLQDLSELVAPADTFGSDSDPDEDLVVRSSLPPTGVSRPSKRRPKSRTMVVAPMLRYLTPRRRRLPCRRKPHVTQFCGMRPCWT
ncbi:hypothetical protein [Streptomyces chartreusis]